MSTRAFLTLFAATATLATTQVSHSVTLSDLTEGYDVFVDGSVTLNSATIYGSIAANGSIEFEQNMNEFAKVAYSSTYAIAARQFDFSPSGGEGKFATGSGHEARIQSLTAGQSIQPNRVYDSADNKSFLFESKGTASEGTLGIDFDGAFNSLKALSTDLSNLAATNVLSDLFSGAPSGSLSGALNVINTSWTGLLGIGDGLFFSKLVNTGKLVINVDLSDWTNNGLSFNQGTTSAADRIIWNFYNGDGSTGLLDLGDRLWIGSILAPESSIKHRNTELHGTVVASSLYKHSELHESRYTGEFEDPDPVPDSGSTFLLALLGGLPLFLLARRRRG